SVTPTSPASNPTVPSVPTTVGGGTGANDSSSGEPTLDTSSEPSGAGKSDVDGTASETDGSQTLPTSEGCAVLAPSGHFQMEALDRGLIAVRNGDGNFVAWRMLGYEFDADESKAVYKLYRDGALVATVTDSTNYFDSEGGPAAKYTVSLVSNGVECAQSAVASVWAQNYLTIPLE